MTVWVYRNGEFVEKQSAPLREAPYVISDQIADLTHPADGKKYDSKSKFRQVTKDRGFVEVGTEKQQDRRQLGHQNYEADIHDAIRKVNDGYRPSTKEVGYSGDGWQ